ncbi:MAG: hypothetical protein ACE15E_14265 [Acidobacteriota bacterium]
MNRASDGLTRRGLLAATLAASPLIAAGARGANPKREQVAAIDFSRSFFHYVPPDVDIWVRIQLDCRGEILDRRTGSSDEYVSSVRVQTGLQGGADAGYDFWFIFGARHFYTRRSHVSYYSRNPSVRPISYFSSSGMQLARRPARLLSNGSEIRDALRSWKEVTARTEFESRDGNFVYAVEYPVKWADGNDDGSFRVETGPVVLLDPEKARPGTDPGFDDFQWAYFDLRGFDQARIFLERPTSILSGATFNDKDRRNPPLSAEQIARVRERLFSGWEPPLPREQLESLFSTERFSVTVSRRVRTALFALEQGRGRSKQKSPCELPQEGACAD